MILGVPSINKFDRLDIAQNSLYHSTGYRVQLRQREHTDSPALEQHTELVTEPMTQMGHRPARKTMSPVAQQQSQDVKCTDSNAETGPTAGDTLDTTDTPDKTNEFGITSTLSTTPIPNVICLYDDTLRD